LTSAIIQLSFLLNSFAMKTFLIIVLFAANVWFCNTHAKQPIGKELNIFLVTNDTVYFVTQIQPILQKNCSPCHFTGGKMYERMPFDKAETIISHEAGVVKRFKNEDELRIIKRFFTQSKITN
jgi:hypothetical protein